MLQIGDTLIHAKSNREFVIRRLSVSNKEGTHYYLVRKDPAAGEEGREFKLSEGRVEKFFFYVPPRHPEAIAEERRERKKKDKRIHGPIRENLSAYVGQQWLDDRWD